MNWHRFAKRAAVVAQLFFLCSTPRLALAQVGQPARDTAARGEDFAGLKFTDDQKAKIDEVHRRMALRKDAAIKSDKLNANQKEAMVAGLGRMERGEIVKLLTPEQQREVLKKVRAGHPATQGEDAKRSPP